jgi:hypothetical protein
MAVNPHTVTSPLKRLRNLRVVYQARHWSLAIGFWDGNRALLIRWNGDDETPMGNPVSHARPTWFVLPDDFWDTSLKIVPGSPGIDALRWLNGKSD